MITTFLHRTGLCAPAMLEPCKAKTRPARRYLIMTVGIKHQRIRTARVDEIVFIASSNRKGRGGFRPAKPYSMRRPGFSCLLLLHVIFLCLSLSVRGFQLGELCCPGCKYKLNPLNCCCAPNRQLGTSTVTLVTTSFLSGTTTAVETRTVVTGTVTRTVTGPRRFALLEGAGVRLGATKEQTNEGPKKWEVKNLIIGRLELDRFQRRRSEVSDKVDSNSRLEKRHLCQDCPAGTVFPSYRMFFGRPYLLRENTGQPACCPVASTRRTVVSTLTSSAVSTILTTTTVTTALTTTTTVFPPTDFTSITTSSGTPVFAPCPSIPVSEDNLCGAQYGERCGGDNLCCSERGFCQDDGGDDGS